MAGLSLGIPEAQEPRSSGRPGRENATSIVELPVEILTLIVDAIVADFAEGWRVVKLSPDSGRHVADGTN